VPASDTASPAAPPGSSSPASAAGSRVDTLRIGTYGLGPLYTDPLVLPMLFDGLMRLDATLLPVPDLARSCDVSADSLTVTCSLRDATFSDGTPVTSDDVAFTLELLKQRCVTLYCAYTLDTPKATSPLTVVFTLTQPDPSFMATLTTPILPRHAVDASYAAWAAADPKPDARRASTLADALDAESLKARPDCAGALAPAEAFASVQHMALIPHGAFVTDSGSFDACADAASVASALRDLASAAGAKGIAAEADAMSYLGFGLAPIGSGPWRVASYANGILALDANPAHAGGVPAMAHVLVTPYGFQPDQLASDFAAGRLDWVPFYTSDTATIGRFQSIPSDPLAFFRRLGAMPGARMAEYPALTLTLIRYNTRPGMLLADPLLRRAIELCLDRQQIVDAATGGTAVPIANPVPPASWAYLPHADRPRDVDGAKALIEQAGWTMGPDGVYRKDGRILAFDVVVREDTASRVKLVDLFTLQLQDCGFDAKARALQHSDMTDLLDTYPHLVPGTNKPFDAVLLGYLTGAEPDFSDLEARQLTSANPPNDPAYYGANFGGYRDDRVQALIEQAQVTSDVKERARIYRDIQTQLRVDPPAFYLWAPQQHDLLTARLTTPNGPLALKSPNWAWDPGSWMFTAP
jgi:ABC-type transport system substrate-binding protein